MTINYMCLLIFIQLRVFFFMFSLPTKITCNTCGIQLTVKHILTEYRMIQPKRVEILSTTHLHEILSPEITFITNLIKYLKLSNL